MAMLDQQGPAAEGEHPLITGMSALHDMTRAKYDKLAQAESLLAKVKRELLPLAKMGDTVSQDDVIAVAGKLVGHGLGASAVAGLLADMPQDGQPLAAWVAQHLQGVQQREQQLAPVLTATRHSLGVHALQLLAAHSIHGAKGPSSSAGPAGASGNPLTQSASPEGAAEGSSSATAPAAPAAGNPLGATGPGPGGPSDAA